MTTQTAQGRPPFWRELIAVIVGLAAIVGFGALIMFLLSQTAADETAWARMLYLFSGVEALAFAAAGFFFGSEVQRRRAMAAEERADVAETRAVEANTSAETAKERVAGVQQDLVEERTRGRTFATAVKSRLAAHSVPLGGSGSGNDGVVLESRTGAAANNLDDLVALADSLYP